MEKDNTGEPPWYPHFARLCAINGANVTAVDITPQGGYDTRLFTATSTDLVSAVIADNLPSLPEIADHQFDIIHSSNFVGNMPHYIMMQLIRLGVGIKEFEGRFFNQAGKLLAEEGIMSLDLRDQGKLIYHTKKEGKLVRI